MYRIKKKEMKRREKPQFRLYFFGNEVAKILTRNTKMFKIINKRNNSQLQVAVIN